MNTELLILVANLLQAFASIARSSTIGTNLDRYAALLELFSRLVSRGVDAIDDLRELTGQVIAMRDTGTVPSLQEIAALKARSDSAHQALQDMKSTSEVLPG